MNENINIAEILKDCPKGFELYTTIFGVVKLDGVFNDYPPYNDYPDGHPIAVIDSRNYRQWFTLDGKYSFDKDAECVLFPSKENRDWSTFTYLPSEAEILSSIFKFEANELWELIDDSLQLGDKVKLKSDLIKGHSYWNVNWVNNDALSMEGTITDCYKHFSHKMFSINNGLLTYSTPMFDIIYILKYNPRILAKIKNKNKEKTIFKPFDKVLVKNHDFDTWVPAIYSHTIDNNGSKEFYASSVIGNCWSQCIPYNDKTSHLVFRNDGAPAEYVTWK